MGICSWDKKGPPHCRQISRQLDSPCLLRSSKTFCFLVGQFYKSDLQNGLGKCSAWASSPKAETQGYACASQKQRAAAQRVSAALCHLPTAHSQSSWLLCTQALWHVWTSPGIWLSIWSETPCGSRACNPAVGAAARVDLEGRLWQAGETSPGGNLHVFHWEGSWQAWLLHSVATAIYS